MITKETYTLNNGNTIPKLGYGTWMIENDDAAKAVSTAIEVGYRHIDTAQAYENEAGVGQGIIDSGIERAELFVTTKIAAEHKSYEQAATSIDESLAKMQLDYLDLVIIHSPQPWAEWRSEENNYFAENKQVWKALEDAVEAGKIRNIGLSNFLKADMDNILEDCKIKPVVNQILAHVSNTPFELMGYCNDHGILVEAYSPIAHGEMLKNDVVIEMAAKYNVSVAQLCIEYIIELGALPLPKTVTKAHMESNADLDFTISKEDMEVFNSMDPINDYGEFSFFPVFSGNNI